MPDGYLSSPPPSSSRPSPTAMGYGFDIMDATGLPSGTVYPALRRMEAAGLIVSKWEDPAVAQREQRPARKYYEVTRSGHRARRGGEPVSSRPRAERASASRQRRGVIAMRLHRWMSLCQPPRSRGAQSRMARRVGRRAPTSGSAAAVDRPSPTSRLDLLRRSCRRVLGRAVAAIQPLVLAPPLRPSLAAGPCRRRLAQRAIAATASASRVQRAVLRPPGVGDPGSLRFIHAPHRDEPYGRRRFRNTATTATRTHVILRGRRLSVLDLEHRLLNDDTMARAGRGDARSRTTSSACSASTPRLGVLGTAEPLPSDGAGDIVIWASASGGSWGPIPLVGTTVRLNDQPVTIVGVTPTTFSGMTPSGSRTSGCR